MFQVDFDKTYDPTKTEEENKNALAGLVDMIRDRDAPSIAVKIPSQEELRVCEWDILYKQCENDLLLVECLYHCALLGKHVNHLYLAELKKEVSLLSDTMKKRVLHKEDENFRKLFTEITSYLVARAR